MRCEDCGKWIHDTYFWKYGARCKREFYCKECGRNRIDERTYNGMHLVWVDKMRIQADKFYELCRIADIPVSASEREAMTEADGNKSRFLKLCKDRGIFLTSNELQLLNITPGVDDDMLEYVEGVTMEALKMDIAKIRAKKIRKGNAHGHTDSR